MSWVHAGLTDLLFLTIADVARAVVGMVQHTDSRWQGFGIYSDVKSVTHKPLGFFNSQEAAREAVESDARREYRELHGASADDMPTEAMDQRVPELAEAVSA